VISSRVVTVWKRRVGVTGLKDLIGISSPEPDQRSGPSGPWPLAPGPCS
jgi:hypothetical protein